MTKSYALLKLLTLGPLSRQEIKNITGWTDDSVFYTIKYLARENKIECVGRKVWRIYEGFGG